MAYHLTFEPNRIGLNSRPRFTPQIMCQNRFVKSAWTPYGPKQVRNGPTPHAKPKPAGGAPLRAGPRIAPMRSGIQRAELMIQSVPPQMSPLIRFTVGVIGLRGLTTTPSVGLMMRPKINAQMIPSIMWIVPPMTNVRTGSAKLLARPSARYPFNVLKSNCGSLTPGNQSPVTVATIVAMNPAAAALVAVLLPIRNLTFESDASSVLSPPVGHRWLHYITLSQRSKIAVALDESGRNLFTVGFPVSVHDGRRRTGPLHRRGPLPRPFPGPLFLASSTLLRAVSG